MLSNIDVFLGVSAVAVLILAATVAYRIATACRHTWVLKDTIRIVSGRETPIPIGHKFILQCSKCGLIKSKEA